MSVTEETAKAALALAQAHYNLVLGQVAVSSLKGEELAPEPKAAKAAILAEIQNLMGPTKDE